jgi:hypothetical protein
VSDRHQGDFFRANNLTVFAQSLVRDVFVMSYKVFDLLNSDIRDQCFSTQAWPRLLSDALMTGWFERKLTLGRQIYGYGNALSNRVLRGLDQ